METSLGEMTKEYETLSVLVAETVAKETILSLFASGRTVMAAPDPVDVITFLPSLDQLESTGIVVRLPAAFLLAVSDVMALLEIVLAVAVVRTPRGGVVPDDGLCT
jgi:hypothetical protein